MSDKIRRFQSIEKSFMKLLPFMQKGNYRRHLETMALIMNGIIANQSCQLLKVASKVADSRKLESRVHFFSPWSSNERIDYTLYYLLFVLRTAKDRKLIENEETFSPRMIGVSQDGYFEIHSIHVENHAAARPLYLLVCWRYPNEEPIMNPNIPFQLNLFAKFIKSVR